MTRGARTRDSDGELLSAWLAGDLDDVRAAALERRLRHDPELAAQADAHRDLLVALHGLDDVQPPAGYRQRLATRIARARETQTPRTAGRVQPPRRVLTAAAAGLVLVAALGGAARVLSTPPKTTVAAGDQTMRSDDRAVALQESAAADGATGTVIEEQDAVPAPEQNPEPLTALGERLASSEQVTALLGRPRAEGAVLARQAAEAVRTTLPGEPCLQPYVREPQAVIARVDLLTVGGDDAIALTLVDASTDSAQLDETRVLVLGRRDCRVLFDHVGNG